MRDAVRQDGKGLRRGPGRPFQVDRLTGRAELKEQPDWDQYVDIVTAHVLGVIGVETTSSEIAVARRSAEETMSAKERARYEARREALHGELDDEWGEARLRMKLQTRPGQAWLVCRSLLRVLRRVGEQKEANKTGDS